MLFRSKIITDDGIEGIGYSGFASSVMVKALKETVDALLEQIISKAKIVSIILRIHFVLLKFYVLLGLFQELFVAFLVVFVRTQY